MSDAITRPLNLGHRGARALAPENTLAGMRAGMAAGADGVEFDVQRTADGHLVVFHDDDLRRICNVSGRIVAAPWRNCGSWTRAAISAPSSPAS